MAVEGITSTPPAGWLTADEIGRVADAARSVGFRKIRLTGGEPTLRPDLLDVVRAVAASGIEDVALTTNTIRLPALARALVAAGLRRVNVHLDSLDPDRVARIMRGATLDEIWRGILAAEAAGLRPIKLNAVVARGFNDAEVVPLAALTRERPWQVRFIETMPLGTGDPARLAREAYVSNVETRARIESALGPLVPLPVVDPGDEARNFRAPGATDVIGFVAVSALVIGLAATSFGTTSPTPSVLTHSAMFLLSSLVDMQLPSSVSPPRLSESLLRFFSSLSPLSH